MDFGRKFFDGTSADVPATGNAPVLLTRRDFNAIIPVWAQIVLAIEEDKAAVERLGWVRDMYAWSFAAAKVKLTHVLPQPPHNPLMVQPPADRRAARGPGPAPPVAARTRPPATTVARMWGRVYRPTRPGS